MYVTVRNAGNAPEVWMAAKTLCTFIQKSVKNKCKKIIGDKMHGMVVIKKIKKFMRNTKK